MDLSKLKKEEFDNHNRRTIKTLQEIGDIEKVFINSSRDKNVCGECMKYGERVIDLKEATIPPIKSCTNPICRCIYFGV
jgi:hypothetical protein